MKTSLTKMPGTFLLLKWAAHSRHKIFLRDLLLMDPMLGNLKQQLFMDKSAHPSCQKNQCSNFTFKTSKSYLFKVTKLHETIRFNVQKQLSIDGPFYCNILFLFISCQQVIDLASKPLILYQLELVPRKKLTHKTV